MTLLTNFVLGVSIQLLMMFTLDYYGIAPAWSFALGWFLASIFSTYIGDIK